MGRWFSDNLANAEWYLNQDNGVETKITYVDIPVNQKESFRVSNIPAKDKKNRNEANDPATWSLMKEEEFFVTPEIAAERKTFIMDTSKPEAITGTYRNVNSVTTNEMSITALLIIEEEINKLNKKPC